MAETVGGRCRASRKEERPWAVAAAASVGIGGFLVLGGAVAAATFAGLAAIKRRGAAGPVEESSATDPSATSSGAPVEAETPVPMVDTAAGSAEAERGIGGDELGGKGFQALLLRLQNHQPPKHPPSALSAPPTSPTHAWHPASPAQALFSAATQAPTIQAASVRAVQPESRYNAASLPISNTPSMQIQEAEQLRAEQGRSGESGTDDERDDREDASDAATGGSWSDSAGEPKWPAEASSEDEDYTSEGENESEMKSLHDSDPIKGRGSVAPALLKDAVGQFIAKKVPAGFTPPASERGKDDLRLGSQLLSAMTSAAVSAKEGASVLLRSGPAALMFVLLAVLILKYVKGSDEELLLLKSFRHLRQALFPATDSSMNCTSV